MFLELPVDPVISFFFVAFDRFEMRLEFTFRDFVVYAQLI